ncbi:Mitochondrial import inner membrane translocase subunit TIM50 [Acorus gramineus]|uniref:Mitochondrial import inner membrane translocase subunit TIM50 n=1 Tax=Acorus gramineus TaxID=55184 RepID=A0AAV9AZV4_ACOGR|nr:Mitochondrial import inner membrane translocase subunit TIM50 [Acorus gramineus]
MSRIVASHLLRHLSKTGRRRFSSSPREPPFTSSSAGPSVTANVGSAPPPAEAAKKSRWLLKSAVFGGLTGAASAAGYVTYAYTLEEVDQKTIAFRQAPKNYSVADDASTFDKFQAWVYSTAMTVPAKAVQAYLDIRKAIEEVVRDYSVPFSEKLLPDPYPQEQHVPTLVLDLNDTLIYTDWKRDRGWVTFKRPGVDAFLERLAQFYEIVVYTDQLNMNVDPILERLDQKGCVRHRLARTATRYLDGKHYRHTTGLLSFSISSLLTTQLSKVLKSNTNLIAVLNISQIKGSNPTVPNDLSKLNRDPSRIIYITAHPDSTLQPENSVVINPWNLETVDTALLDLLPFLEYVAMNKPPDIRATLASYQGKDIPTEFIERTREYQRRMKEQKPRTGLFGRH